MMECIFRARGEAPTIGFTLTLTGEYDESGAYVTVSGTKYTASQALILEPGTAVSVYIKGSNSKSAITFNGEQVGRSGSTYTFNISAPTAINMTYTTGLSGLALVTATITT